MSVQIKTELPDEDEYDENHINKQYFSEDNNSNSHFEPVFVKQEQDDSQIIKEIHNTHREVPNDINLSNNLNQEDNWATENINNNQEKTCNKQNSSDIDSFSLQLDENYSEAS